MDADVSAMERYAEVPYVIEAPASKGAMLGAAANALAAKGLKVRIDESRGMPVARYRGMIEEIRAQIQSQLTPQPGFVINIYDSSTTNSGAEMAKIHASLRNKGSTVAKLAAAKGAFSGAFKDPDQKVHCLVVGLKPDFDVDRYVAFAAGVRNVNRSGMGDDQFHRMTVFHELGHCLLGTSEAKADAFAALMALRDPSATRESLSMWASWREAAEWTLPATDDDHFTAKGVWAVIDRADELLADPAFREMSMDGVAGLAKAIVEERGMGPAEQADVSSVRRAVRAGVDALARGHASRFGTTALSGWMRQHGDIPEIARILEIQSNLSGVARPMAPFAFEPGAFRKAIGALAASGDRVAGTMARAYDAAPHAHSHDAKEVAGMHNEEAASLIPFKLARTPYENRVITYGSARPPAKPDMAALAHGTHEAREDHDEVAVRGPAFR